MSDPICVRCGRIAKLLCAKCLVTPYCSKACQLAAWPYHKLICKAPDKSPLPSPSPSAIATDKDGGLRHSSANVGGDVNIFDPQNIELLVKFADKRKAQDARRRKAKAKNAPTAVGAPDETTTAVVGVPDPSGDIEQGASEEEEEEGKKPREEEYKEKGYVAIDVEPDETVAATMLEKIGRFYGFFQTAKAPVSEMTKQEIAARLGSGTVVLDMDMASAMQSAAMKAAQIKDIYEEAVRRGVEDVETERMAWNKMASVAASVSDIVSAFVGWVSETVSPALAEVISTTLTAAMSAASWIYKRTAESLVSLWKYSTGFDVPQNFSLLGTIASFISWCGRTVWTIAKGVADYISDVVFATLDAVGDAWSRVEDVDREDSLRVAMYQRGVEAFGNLLEKLFFVAGVTTSFWLYLARQEQAIRAGLQTKAMQKMLDRIARLFATISSGIENLTDFASLAWTEIKGLVPDVVTTAISKAMALASDAASAILGSNPIKGALEYVAKIASKTKNFALIVANAIANVVQNWIAGPAKWLAGNLAPGLVSYMVTDGDIVELAKKHLARNLNTELYPKTAKVTEALKDVYVAAERVANYQAQYEKWAATPLKFSDYIANKRKTAQCSANVVMRILSVSPQATKRYEAKTTLEILDETMATSPTNPVMVIDYKNTVTELAKVLLAAVEEAELLPVGMGKGETLDADGKTKKKGAKRRSTVDPQTVAGYQANLAAKETVEKSTQVARAIMSSRANAVSPSSFWTHAFVLLFSTLTEGLIFWTTANNLKQELARDIGNIIDEFYNSYEQREYVPIYRILGLATLVLDADTKARLKSLKAEYDDASEYMSVLFRKINVKDNPTTRNKMDASASGLIRYRKAKEDAERQGISQRRISALVKLGEDKAQGKIPGIPAPGAKKEAGVVVRRTEEEEEWKDEWSLREPAYCSGEPGALQGEACQPKRWIKYLPLPSTAVATQPLFGFVDSAKAAEHYRLLEGYNRLRQSLYGSKANLAPGFVEWFTDTKFSQVVKRTPLLERDATTGANKYATALVAISSPRSTDVVAAKDVAPLWSIVSTSSQLVPSPPRPSAAGAARPPSTKETPREITAEELARIYSVLNAAYHQWENEVRQADARLSAERQALGQAVAEPPSNEYELSLVEAAADRQRLATQNESIMRVLDEGNNPQKYFESVASVSRYQEGFATLRSDIIKIAESKKADAFSAITGGTLDWLDFKLFPGVHDYVNDPNYVFMYAHNAFPDVFSGAPGGLDSVRINYAPFRDRARKYDAITKPSESVYTRAVKILFVEPEEGMTKGISTSTKFGASGGEISTKYLTDVVDDTSVWIIQLVVGAIDWILVYTALRDFVSLVIKAATGVASYADLWQTALRVLLDAAAVAFTVKGMHIWLLFIRLLRGQSLLSLVFRTITPVTLTIVTLSLLYFAIVYMVPTLLGTLINRAVGKT